jgi:homoserine dehydrogenase
MIQVALLGFGVVGSGVAEVLSMNAAHIAEKAGDEIELKYIVDVREFPDSPFAGVMIKDFSIVEQDPNIKIVVEVIGGAGVAYDFTKRSLRAGKSVVTSNKELVATHGYELLCLAREMGVNYLFEASVGGGIPILRPITQCLTANRITEVYGILNGTTNYILTGMSAGGVSFEEALSEAQSLGYAEKINPEADVEGEDAARKICILAALAFGRHLYPESVNTEGIRAVTSEDIANAGLCGCKIKLLGRAVIKGDDKVSAYVAPHFVAKGNLLATVDGVMNGIIVRGNAVGTVLFYGPGAGKLPTASAVAADVIDAAKHLGLRKLLSWEDCNPRLIENSDTLRSRWYIRCGADGEKITAAVPNARLIEGASGTALITPPMSKNDIAYSCGGSDILSMFRILD